MVALYNGNRADGKGYFSILLALMSAVEHGVPLNRRYINGISFSTICYKYITEIFICQMKLFCLSGMVT
jgi:hypothetical protein